MTTNIKAPAQPWLTAGRTVAAIVLTALLIVTVVLTNPAHAEQATPEEQCSIEPALSTQVPTVLRQLGVRKTWDLTEGRDIKVALLSTGVDAGNPHLGDSILPGVDLIGETDGRTDDNGTGTFLAGQIMAHKIDGSEVVGIAPAASILPIKVSDQSWNEMVDSQDGESLNSLAQLLAQGIGKAAEFGAKIIVIPYALTVDNLELDHAVQWANDQGILVLASSGNAGNGDKESGTTTVFPAAYDSVMGVTGLNQDTSLSGTANTGAHVDIAVPAQNVVSTYRFGGDCTLASDQADSAMATAYAAGIATLVASANPNESPQMWKYRIMVTASRTGTTRNDSTGWGIISPYAAVALIDDGNLTGPPHPLGREKQVAATQMMAAPQAEEPVSSVPLILIIVASSIAVLAAVQALKTLKALPKKTEATGDSA